MRWLCLDLGEKRTGVALSSPGGTFAVPLCILEHGIGGPSPEEIVLLIDEHAAGGLVVGLPLSLSGSPSRQTFSVIATARRIADYLGSEFSLPDGIVEPEQEGGEDGLFAARATRQRDIAVVLWDERLSTWGAGRLAAPEELRRRGQKKRRGKLDAHAAAVILQSYLDSLEQAQVRENPAAELQ